MDPYFRHPLLDSTAAGYRVRVRGISVDLANCTTCYGSDGSNGNVHVFCGTLPTWRTFLPIDFVALKYSLDALHLLTEEMSGASSREAISLGQWDRNFWI